MTRALIGEFQVFGRLLWPRLRFYGQVATPRYTLVASRHSEQTLAACGIDPATSPFHNATLMARVPPLVPDWTTFLTKFRAYLYENWASIFGSTRLSRPEPRSSGTGPSDDSPKDPNQLTVDKLVELLAASSDYVVHRTANPGPGMMREALEARQPGPGPDAPPGVYAMRGITGVDYGPFGVVFLADGRFREFRQGEFICSHDLAPKEAIGWYHVDDLKKAQAKRSGR